jgi:long-chain acyl-CoA synthetase
MLRDGWIFTGDIAVMDEQGFFRIAGRKKDLIIVSGYNVFPDEVDRVLKTHPQVADAGTIGVPDPRSGEAIRSFVVRRTGHTPSEAEILAHCRELLAPFKVPRSVEFVTEIPRTLNDKVDRKQLRSSSAVA